MKHFEQCFAANPLVATISTSSGICQKSGSATTRTPLWRSVSTTHSRAPVVRAPTWQHETLAKSLAGRRTLAVFMSVQSRAGDASKPSGIMNVAEAAVAQALLIHGAAVTVHGHTHRYGIHQIIAADLHQTRYMLAN